jgi:glycosyltransferase involved in cell wall biosynthesis
LYLGPLPPNVGGIATFVSSMLNSELKEKYTLLAFDTGRPTFGVSRSVSGYSLIGRIGFLTMVQSVFSTIFHLLSFPMILLIRKPDIVHINTPSYWSFWENTLYLVMSRFFNKKVILHIHGGKFNCFYLSSNTVSRFMIRSIMVFPHIIIVLSPTWKRILSEFSPKARIVVLPNFVETSSFKDSIPKKASLNVADKKIINILFVGGAGAKEKGLYDVIEAACLVIMRRKNVFFTFAGCSNMKDLTSLCEGKGLSEYTRILDFVSGKEKYQLYLESDIFVLPSYAEGFPITMLEAMAAGLPVVASHVGAIPDVIRDGDNGFLIQAGDFKVLAEKIMLLVDDSILRQKMSDNNIVKVAKYYDKPIVLKAIQSEYEKLLRTNSTYS